MHVFVCAQLAQLPWFKLKVGVTTPLVSLLCILAPRQSTHSTAEGKGRVFTWSRKDESLLLVAHTCSSDFYFFIPFTCFPHQQVCHLLETLHLKPLTVFTLTRATTIHFHTLRHIHVCFPNTSYTNTSLNIRWGLLHSLLRPLTSSNTFFIIARWCATCCSASSHQMLHLQVYPDWWRIKCPTSHWETQSQLPYSYDLRILLPKISWYNPCRPSVTFFKQWVKKIVNIHLHGVMKVLN